MAPVPYKVYYTFSVASVHCLSILPILNMGYPLFYEEIGRFLHQIDDRAANKGIPHTGGCTGGKYAPVGEFCEVKHIQNTHAVPPQCLGLVPVSSPIIVGGWRPWGWRVQGCR